jgi:hypothetical protein
MSQEEIEALDAEGLRYFPLQPFLDQFAAQMDTVRCRCFTSFVFLSERTHPCCTPIINAKQYIKSRMEDAEIRLRDTQAELDSVRIQCSSLRAALTELKGRQVGAAVAAAAAATTATTTTDTPAP